MQESNPLYPSEDTSFEKRKEELRQTAIDTNLSQILRYFIQERLSVAQTYINPRNFGYGDGKGSSDTNESLTDGESSINYVCIF